MSEHYVILYIELLYFCIIHIFWGINCQFVNRKGLLEVDIDITQIGPYGPMNDLCKLY